MKITKLTEEEQSIFTYIDCLTSAHNEMIGNISDPRNKYVIMEQNPLNSQDDMYGIPK